MKQVILFVYYDMTVIDLGQDDCYDNFLTSNYDAVIADVVKIEKRANGGYAVHTDFKNPYRNTCSVFYLSEENFAKVRWIEK